MIRRNSRRSDDNFFKFAMSNLNLTTVIEIKPAQRLRASVPAQVLQRRNSRGREISPFVAYELLANCGQFVVVCKRTGSPSAV